jgi:hypothetical protein
VSSGARAMTGCLEYNVSSGARAMTGCLEMRIMCQVEQNV